VLVTDSMVELSLVVQVPICLIAADKSVE
jgi:hypothetical protein